MSTTTKRIIYTCLTLTLGVCVCLSIVSIVGAGFWIVDRSEIINVPGMPTEIPDVVLPDNVDEQMDLIQNQIMQLF